MLTLITVVAVAASGLLLPIVFGGGIAAAAEGAAPAPTEYRVLETEHSDTIATFWDGGDFALGSKADVDGSLGVRFPADGILIHVNDLARYDSWPAGYEFVAPTGSTVWLAPQTRKDGVVWPGFSTESVPSGVLNGNITFTLDDVTGPGSVELWTSNAFGGVQERLWSSDEAVKSFARPINTHMHANWAFTQPGTYRLTVTASATTVGGAAVSDTQTYTFVAGPLVEQATTSTALHIVGETTVTEGTPVEFHATVTPASVEGYVEFRDGATVLGHLEVEDGEAELETSGLGIGTHNVTAHFIPKVVLYATASDSEAVEVTVTSAEGVPFAIVGVQDAYTAGDTLTATVAGYALDPGASAYGQRFRWLIRQIGSSGGAQLQYSTAATYAKALGATDDGYEISVTVRTCNTSGCGITGGASTLVMQSAWVPIHVAADGTAPVLVVSSGTPEAMYTGDTAGFEARGLELAEGETTQWMSRTSSTWAVLNNSVALGVVKTTTTLELTQATYNNCSTCSGELVVVVLRDGVSVRQSAPVNFKQEQFELQTSGLQGLYFEGTPIELNGTIYPVRESDADFTYQWQLFASATDMALNRNAVVWGEDSAPSIERVATMADNEGFLRLVARKPGFTGQTSNYVATSATMRVYVTDDPDAQLFFLNTLSGHYHQGESVNLSLKVEPAPQIGDRIDWEWKWPGADWSPFPDASGLSHPIPAEQALDEVQVRATLDFAAEGKDSLVTDPVTILVDDHGAAARQQPTVGGETSVTEGDTVTLIRELPSSGATILTEHRWERLAAGAEEWTVIEGKTGAELSFSAAAADDGAQYRVSIVKPNGEFGYGPSPAVTLEVEAAPEPEPTVPVAPAIPGITADGSTVSVTWIAPVDGGAAITGYTVTLTPASGDLITQDAAADATSATFTEVPVGTWTATVVATNVIGDSEPSASSTSVTVAAVDPEPDPEPEPEPEPTAPAMPTVPGITVDGSTVAVTWVVPNDGGSAITGYTVTLTPSTGDAIIRSAAAGATSIQVTDVPAGTWTATVAATNPVGTSGTSPASDPVTVAAPEPEPDPEPAVPAAPAAPSATVSGSTVKVTWVAPNDGGSVITGYVVTLAPTTGEGIVRNATAGVTELTFTGVPVDAWTATVVATNAVGSSPTSAASPAVTVTAAGEPAPEPDPEPTPGGPAPVPDSELTDATRGGVSAPESTNPGQQITITVPGHAGEQVLVWLYSTPVLLGTVTLDASGKATVTIPGGTAAGTHRIAVQARDGTLIGWTDIRVAGLASTGTDLNLPVTIGSALVLMLLGAGILVVGRRRRTALSTSAAE